MLWNRRPTPILPVSVLNPVGPGPGGSRTTAGTPPHVPERVIHCALLPGVACTADGNMNNAQKAAADNTANRFFAWVRVMRAPPFAQNLASVSLPRPAVKAQRATNRGSPRTALRLAPIQL